MAGEDSHPPSVGITSAHPFFYRVSVRCLYFKKFWEPKVRNLADFSPPHPQQLSIQKPWAPGLAELSETSGVQGTT